LKIEPLFDWFNFHSLEWNSISKNLKNRNGNNQNLLVRLFSTRHFCSENIVAVISCGCERVMDDPINTSTAVFGGNTTTELPSLYTESYMWQTSFVNCYNVYTSFWFRLLSLPCFAFKEREARVAQPNCSQRRDFPFVILS